MATTSGQELLTAREAMERLKVSRKTLTRFYTTGLIGLDGNRYRLAALQMGGTRGRIFIRPEWIDDFLEATSRRVGLNEVDASRVPYAPESPSRRQKRFAADKEAALKACRGEI